MTNNDHAPKPDRVIVTIKPYPYSASGRKSFKIVGPDRSTEIRDTSNIRSRFYKPLTEGAKEVKAFAYLNNSGRWSLIELVPPGGLEPLITASTAQRSDL